jgi:hypothetical protein
MAEEGDRAESVDVVVQRGQQALTIHLNGTRFEGGRLPISALSTLDKMNAMVASIARDLDMASPGRSRASRYSKVELVLVGEIESGSAIFKLLISPVLVATSATSLDAQTALLKALPDAIPAVVQAVHTGGKVPIPLSERTVVLISEVGQDLREQENLVLRPADSGTLADAVDDKSVTVTRASSNQARLVQNETETRSFFVTGTLRNLENHGDEVGGLRLATTSGLYEVPTVDPGIVKRAAGLVSFGDKWPGRVRRQRSAEEANAPDRHAKHRPTVQPRSPFCRTRRTRHLTIGSSAHRSSAASDRARSSRDRSCSRFIP